MIVCPVCEHPQAAGEECEVCGKRLVVAARAAPAPVAVIPELELTAVVRPGLQVPSERMADLEQTRVENLPDVPIARVPDIEATRSAPVGEILVLPIDELDAGREEDDGVRTALPTGALICRYCRNEQASGGVCDKCGMRLPRVAVAKPAAAAGELDWTVCRDCGARGRIGLRCPACGSNVLGAE